MCNIHTYIICPMYVYTYNMCNIYIYMYTYIVCAKHIYSCIKLPPQKFNSMLHKIVSDKDISYKYICKYNTAFRPYIVNITY